MERTIWAVGRSGEGVGVEGLVVGDGGWAVEGEAGETGIGEGGLAVAMAQKGQFGSAGGGGIGECSW